MTILSAGFCMLSLGILVVARLNFATVTRISTGEQIVATVAAFGVSGLDSVLQLDAPFVSVANASLADPAAVRAQAAAAGKVPYGSGTLSIVGRSGDAEASVMDAAMRSLLLPHFTFGIKAVLEATNLTLVRASVL
jgi:hypothetical protein